MDERTMVYLDDVVKVIYQALRTPVPDYHKDPFHDSMGVAMAMANEIPPAQPEQRWIPASERIPELGQLVLVTSAIDGDIHLCTQCATDGQMFIMDGTRYHVLGKAWMPLPEPYKGDAE